MTKELLVERVVNGGRSVRYQETLPLEMEFVVTETDAVVDEETGLTTPPHLHITFGTEEELKDVGLKVKKSDNGRKKPRAKATDKPETPAPPKSPAASAAK